MRISDWSADGCSSDLAAQLRVDARIVHQAIGDQWHAIEQHLLVCHHRTTLGRPVRLGPVALDQVRAESFGPLGVDRGVLARPRPEVRRVGKELVSTCRYRWSPYY